LSSILFIESIQGHLSFVKPLEISVVLVSKII
jgi:hypothetical protein